MDAPLTTPAIVYPESDGKPMAETWIHVRAMHWLHQALEDFFHDRPDVFIASDMFWYWKEGRTKTTAPDVMVVPGVGHRARRSFFTWKENGAVPAVVFEMASEGTWRKDLAGKRRLYERRGVSEYFIFDPEDLYLEKGPLLGFRLDATGRFRTLDPIDGVLSSELGFDMRPEGTMLRLVDRKTSVPVPTRSEKVAEEEHRADEEKRRADEEKHRADEQKRRADALQAEVERLKALLARAGGAPSGNCA